jgi:hypothetical protein
MEQTQAVNNEVTIYNNALETFRNGGEILAANQAVVSKAVTAGQSLLAKIAANGGKLNQELDTTANDYLAKISKRKKELEEGRKPVTQMMDTVKKFFTAEEGKLDVTSVTTIPYQVQQHRNAYAKELALQEQQRAAEAAKKVAKDRERVQLAADCETQLNTYFNGYLLNYKQQMQNGFNGITLVNYEEKAIKLNALSCVYSHDHYAKFAPSLRAVNLDQTDLQDIATNITADNYPAFAARFTKEVEELKQQLIDRLPSKKSELEAIAAAEKARIEEEEKARVAEQKRQEEIAKANGERKKQLEEQARIQKEEEQKRIAAQEAERKRLEADRMQREQEEVTRIAKEAQDAQLKAEQEIQMNKAAGDTMALFDQEATLAEGVAAGDVRQGFQINVQHAAGFVQIFQFWFENEGKSLPLDKMGNTKLDQMKAWCEKHAHKTGEIIDSKFLQYEPTYKAVNRKAS